MRAWGIFLAFFILVTTPHYAHTPLYSTHRTLSFLERFSQTDEGNAPSLDHITSLLKKLESRKQTSKSDVQFLHFLFVKVHQRFLKTFEPYASFQETLSEGTYNCLTGTALYAVLLEHFNYEYQIIETTHHIFLQVKIGEDRVLFEATDPFKGFVSDKRDVEERIRQYQQQTGPSLPGRFQYQFINRVYNEVALHQLLGLLHYNHAVEAFNDQDLTRVIGHLHKAMTLYASPRIEEFSKLVTVMIMESNLDQHLKRAYIARLYSARTTPGHPVAAATRVSF